LDEPTNHLDLEAREALVEELNDYAGAVIVVSHDRHLLELTADRLVLIANGRAAEFAGSLDDYRDLVLADDAAAGACEAGPAKRAARRDARRLAAEARANTRGLRQAIKAAEAEIAILTEECQRIDQALQRPDNAGTGDLLRTRAELVRRLEAAEARWLDLSAALEREAAED
ncbi:MAG: ABC transporter ATP-binding protein, partial [Stellaceae bacterium]